MTDTELTLRTLDELSQNPYGEDDGRTDDELAEELDIVYSDHDREWAADLAADRYADLLAAEV